MEKGIEGAVEFAGDLQNIGFYNSEVGGIDRRARIVETVIL